MGQFFSQLCASCYGVKGELGYNNLIKEQQKIATRLREVRDQCVEGFGRLVAADFYNERMKKKQPARSGLSMSTRTESGQRGALDVFPGSVFLWSLSWFVTSVTQSRN